VNIETILAEKFHTIISRGLANSRSKDFYDIYAIVRLKENQIDRQILKAAFENTFAYRKTPIHFDQFSQLLITIRENPLMNTRWNAFSRNNPFVSGTPFADTIQACSYLLELVKNAS
jgi:predicted nucleotidyltransferase component of viral defense system